ncbi:hypothetical protein JCM8547_006170 [Rhodosporidiobolus lusitaniae]
MHRCFRMSTLSHGRDAAPVRSMSGLVPLTPLNETGHSRASSEPPTSFSSPTSKASSSLAPSRPPLKTVG